MATKPDSDVVDGEEARRKFLQATVFSKAKFLATVERPVDEIKTVPIPKVFDGKEHGILEFKKWTHQQASRFYNLPFIDKFEGKVPLTEEEKQQYFEFQKSMILDTILDKGKWKELVEASKPFVIMLFDLIAGVSGVTKDFDDRLAEFADSDFGLAYGLMWFQTFGKMPSDIAVVSETDYKMVVAWFQRWMEKVNQNISRR